MTYRKLNRDEHLLNDGLPKRILALDGGGIRGILTLGMLQKVEDILRERYGNDGDFRLCHYFDLIAGTSTGAIIAAGLAMGMKVDDLRDKYMRLGKSVFEKSLFRKGFFRAVYNKDMLIAELKGVYGADTTLGSDLLKTGLLIVTKRLDTGSPWPVSNNPRGRYFGARPGGTIGNSEYPLWQVVRASTAAPHYFAPETIKIAQGTARESCLGEFVDGGISPFNNSALQAFMYATMEGYRIGWPTGAEKILLVSAGTGRVDPGVAHSFMTAEHTIKSLLALILDCSTLQETLLQWMSTSPTARPIDRELGDQRHDLIANEPLLSYLRYDVDFTKENIQRLLPKLIDEKQIASLSEMDDPDNMEMLHALGAVEAARSVNTHDFAANFDLLRG